MKSQDVVVDAVPSHVPSALVFFFDYRAESTDIDDPFKPAQALASRGAPPFFYTPANGGHWVAREYEAIDAIFKDHQNFQTFPIAIPPFKDAARKIAPIEIDPPDHKKYRGVLAPLFTPLAAKRSMELIRQSVNELIDSFIDAGQCDFVSQFAFQLPTKLFLEFMGMPAQRVDEFVRWTHLIFNGSPSEQATAASSIVGYITEFVEMKVANPGDDWTSVLIAAQDPNGGSLFTRDELIDTCYSLFLAGLDTVPSTFTHSWRYLADHPELRAVLIDDPERIPDAVEELCRVHAVANTSRRARHDMEFGHIKLKAGDAILLMCSLANNDATRFADPSVVNLDREANVHLSFGAGVHRCIGSNLARAEMRIALQEWLRRIPDFEVVKGTSIQSVGGTNFGLRTLPLSWPAAR